MSRLIFREEIVIFLITIAFIAGSIFPTLNIYRKTPPSSVYTFLHNSVSDYPYYISFIRQGIEGRNTTIDQFTTESQTPGFIHIFYLALGGIGGIFSFSPVQIYFLARIILGIVFLLIGYAFISFFLKKSGERILAFLFFITSASFPSIMFTKNGIEIWPYLFWWSEIDPLRRATFIPHFLMGHIGLAGGLLLLLYLFKTKKPIFLLAAIILGIITGLSHPPSLGMIYYVFGGYFIIKIIISFSRELARKTIFFLLFILFTVSTLIYIYRTTNNVFPWTLMKAQESLFYAIDITEYLLSLGLIFILGVLGILILLRRSEHSSLLIPVLWVIIDIIMIPVSKFIAFTSLPVKIPTFANIRFLSMSLQLPLAILSVYFLRSIKNRFGQRLFWITIGLYTVVTIIMYPASLQTQLNDFSQASQFVYPRKTLIEAFAYLNKNTNEDEVVLADEDTSLLLPLFAKNKVYFGQSIYTYQNDLKSQNASLFSQGELKDCESYEFLSEGKISYILITEKQQLEKLKTKKFLSPLFNNDDINIYRFNPNIRC